MFCNQLIAMYFATNLLSRVVVLLMVSIFMSFLDSIESSYQVILISIPYIYNLRYSKHFFIIKSFLDY